MRVSLFSLGLLSACALALPGCPAEVKDTQAAPLRKSTPQVDESDPRVVKIDDDLYASRAVPEQPAEGEAKGSGKPDESNGYCRLYAPKLPEPHCCRTEYGFDAEAASGACGNPLYLGESFLRSCGYYFHDAEAGEPVWFRTSFVEAESPKAAAEAEAKRLQLRFGKPVEFRALKAVPDAYTLEFEGIGYAWVSGDPGWPNLRRLSWEVGSTCSEEGIEQVVGQMATAKPPPQGAQRLGLVPEAR